MGIIIVLIPEVAILCEHERMPLAFSVLTGTHNYHSGLIVMCVCFLGKFLVYSQCNIECACRQVSFQVLPHWLL